MSVSRWVITPSWLSGSWWYFLYLLVFCLLFLISSASVRSIPFLSFIVPIFAWKVPLVSNFLEAISSLSHFIVFLYFFALITEEGFLMSPCYSLHSDGYIFPFLLCLFRVLFSQLFVCFAFLHFFFMGMVLITASCTMSWTFVHSSSGTLSIRSSALKLFVNSAVNCKRFDLGHTWMV